ncbi:MAG: TIGR00730 family Rossman fold protein [Microthrixaceae bacterium]|nr:TIGR00730 family Rossman fold protein [Microthrixaceae bacterium]
MDPDRPRPRIAVYCASRVGSDPAFAEVAHDVGEAIAARGADLVFGGGSIGLMGVLADAALAGGSHVIGVITEALLGREVAHRGVTELRITADMPARKQQMYAEADAFCTLPGGIGTMEEFFEVLTWGYLGIHPKPMGLVNVNGFYDPLLGFLDHAIDQGLLRPSVMELLVVGRDAGVIDGLLDSPGLQTAGGAAGCPGGLVSDTGSR